MSSTNTQSTKQSSGQLKKEFPGEFLSDLTGLLLTVNINEWGIRGKLKTEANEEYIYLITYDKTAKEHIPLLTKGDKVTFSRVYVTTYSGKIAKWSGLSQAKLCKNATIRILQKAKSDTTICQNGQSKTSQISVPTTISSNMQVFENLQQKVKEARESLTTLEKIVSLKESVSITSKDFIRVTTQASLHYQRLFSAILLVLEQEV